MNQTIESVIQKFKTTMGQGQDLIEGSHKGWTYGTEQRLQNKYIQHQKVYVPTYNMVLTYSTQ